jgi:hypothetical protein
VASTQQEPSRPILALPERVVPLLWMLASGAFAVMGAFQKAQAGPEPNQTEPTHERGAG